MKTRIKQITKGDQTVFIPQHRFLWFFWAGWGDRWGIYGENTLPQALIFLERVATKRATKRIVTIIPYNTEVNNVR